MKMNIMKKAITLLSIVTLSILAMPVYAHQNLNNFNSYDRIDRRLDNQHNRIRNGINSGELTRKEARRLRKQQRFITRLSYKFMSNGYLSRHEVRKLTHVLELASMRIYRLKHNDRNHYTKYNDRNRYAKNNTNRYYY